MNFISAVGSLLADLGVSQQSDQPDFPISLLFDDRWEVIVDLDTEKQEIIVSVPVRSVSINSLSNAEAARNFLLFSLLGAKTNGCSLSFSTETQSLVIWFRHPDDFPTEQSAEDLLDRVISTAVFMEGWSQENLNDSQDKPDPNASSQTDQEKSDWLKI